MPPQPAYPASLEIRPVKGLIRSVVHVPGSKSMTNRGLVLAALYGDDHGSLTGALRSEDTEVMIDCLRRLGFEVETNWVDATVRVFRSRHTPWAVGTRSVPAPTELFVANSGTSIRFLTAMVCLLKGRFRLDGVPRMRERPMEDLLVALRQLGVHAHSDNKNGCPPIIVEANGLAGGQVRIKAAVSSQFLSALLMVAPLARNPLTIDVEGPLVSEPYVAMTVTMMERIGVTIGQENGRRFRFTPVRPAGAVSIPIEPDASAASYFFAAAAITGGQVTIAGLDETSLQGDFRFVNVLEQMGCHVDKLPGTTVVNGGALRGVDVDMNDISDTVMTLAAVACFAEGPTRIRNIGHIRHKETDRLAALATELRRIGGVVEEFADGLNITPQPLHGAEIETYNDHRMAMSMAMIGLKVPGIVIKNPACVAKTYPGFFQDLERIQAAG